MDFEQLYLCRKFLVNFVRAQDNLYIKIRTVDILYKFYRSIINLFRKETHVFKCLQYKNFGNTVCKGEIARNEQFLLFPQCFLPFWKTFHHFHRILNCRLQTLSVWKSLRFVVRERFKYVS